ncbi:Spermidine/putrescine import ATP-binding protein PotA [Serratia entomophila]|jgi:iron(III) transport system ATP-binding protein|uniref:ABC transporter ATP-binding protein n=1 Tax=Serratia entomophila TaxID=42906 RepID=A0ABY5CQ45_9GAMM|nr:ABC transporter ATP-binding protein [Serratia entomophila]UIW17642.1 ABC transporter ATP-binding protein [Serratia entomophila]USV00207.1 ABC transporter ATP-binding protein [Serratia entomophila]CAI0707724.1 Spermidine/putrescine import ATP-binding protein PotA [Serratia entomophila]CAI0784345.1 Spermidine/putrescine import ATP-binding protein PotA [Serratia entomophila]CAI0918411.1 Spermidine/putrescine import ATP-binding protein PotA [Serratia entomophila]
MIELSVDNLHLTYGDNPVLKGVSMELKRGEVVSLLGPSGSGKTTLLRAVAGLEKPTQGRIVIGSNAVYDGSARSEIPAEERNLGLVFQSYALWPHKTVFENVAYPLKLRKIAGAEITQRVQAVLEQLGLGHLGQRHPHQLSGGQQQRVAIGRALVYNPPVILLDEPLSNLDAKLREEARVFLRELIIKLGLSALMVTHDQNEAMAISDRILLLNNGKIEQQGTPQAMYGAPSTLFTAEFMGSNNRLPGKVVALEGDRARIEGKDWSLWGVAGKGLQVGQEGIAVIRVERVRLGEDPQGNQLELPLLTSMYLGDRWEYLFRTVAEDFVVRAYGSEVREQALCRLSLPTEHLWVFPKE